jgi:hypothetical protein
MPSSDASFRPPATEPPAPSAETSQTARAELWVLDPRRWRGPFAEVERETWVICIVAAAGLILHEQVFRAEHFFDAVRAFAPEWGRRVFLVDKPHWASILRFAWWTCGTTLGWVAVPLLAGSLVCGHGPRDYGLRAIPLRKMTPYALVLASFVPVIALAAAFVPGFAATYPYFRPEPADWLWRTFLLYELAYGLQFFAVEFFFRGYLVNGLGRAMGYRAVLVALLPYVMLHFRKPMPEALGSIVAGTILGAFALRTGSIWGGLLIHVGVAWSMDILALALGSGRSFPTAF